jgi:hypothetical protein
LQMLLIACLGDKAAGGFCVHGRNEHASIPGQGGQDLHRNTIMLDATTFELHACNLLSMGQHC